MSVINNITSDGYVENLMHSADCFYRQKFISKKNGKFRELTIPNNKLKTIQNIFKTELDFMYLSLKDPSAVGFIKGVSPKFNARMHINKDFVYNADIFKFFDSIKFNEFEKMFRFWYAEADFKGGIDKYLNIIRKYCFYLNKLPQGAPTSPVLSNIFMTTFDVAFKNQLILYDIIEDLTYTRYADDITVSFNLKDSDSLSNFVKNKLNEDYDYSKHKYEVANIFKNRITNTINDLLKIRGLVLNRDKTDLRSIANRQSVTGICVNPKQEMLGVISAHKSDSIEVIYINFIPMEKYLSMLCSNSKYLKSSLNTPLIKRNYFKAKIHALAIKLANSEFVKIKEANKLFSYWEYLLEINPINFLKLEKEYSSINILLESKVNHKGVKKLFRKKIMKRYSKLYKNIYSQKRITGFLEHKINSKTIIKIDDRLAGFLQLLPANDINIDEFISLLKNYCVNKYYLKNEIKPVLLNVSNNKDRINHLDAYNKIKSNNDYAATGLLQEANLSDINF